MEPVERARAFMLLAEQSFNYDIHGKDGFNAMGRLVEQCISLRFSYSNLDDGVLAFDQLATDQCL